MSGLEVSSPWDGHLIQTVGFASDSQIENMVKKGHEFFQKHPQGLPLYERIEVLERCMHAIKGQKESLALSASEEGGKPIKDSLVEVERAISGIRYAVAHIQTTGGKEIPMTLTPYGRDRFAFTQRQPIGMVLAISAFNHPINLIVHQAVCAFAAGCPVVIKPSLKTPLSCMKIVELLHKSGCPEEACQVLICDDGMTEDLVSNPKFKYVSFVGSAQVGWYLRSKLSPGTRCLLEHGGAAPVIIEKDADIEQCASALVKGAFYHAGQICVSTQRIYAHHKILKTFTKQFIDASQKLILGDPLHEQTDVGPVINQSAIHRIDEWVKEAVYKGGKLLLGGKFEGETMYAPTIIQDVPKSAMLMNAEIFGPVVTIQSYKEEQDAISEANRLPLCFQSSVFTQNVHIMKRIASALKANTVLVNDHTAFRVDWMPFAALEQSGRGIGGIGYAIDDMSFDKMTVIHSPQVNK